VTGSFSHLALARFYSRSLRRLSTLESCVAYRYRYGDGISWLTGNSNAEDS